MRRQLSWAQVGAITADRTIEVVNVVHTDDVVGVVVDDDGELGGEAVDVL